MSFINYITQIQFGFGSLSLLQQECDRVGIRQPLIVTDMGVRATGIIDRVLSTLNNAKPSGIYDGTPPNPNERAVRDAVEVYRQGKHDGIIAVHCSIRRPTALRWTGCAAHGPILTARSANPMTGKRA